MPPRLVALVSLAGGADLTAITDAYLASPEFAADIEGFYPCDVVAVDTMLLDAMGFSPIRADPGCFTGLGTAGTPLWGPVTPCPCGSSRA